MNIVGKLKKHGALGSARIAANLAAAKVRNAQYAYYKWSVRKAPRYSSPTMPEFAQIERSLREEGIEVYDYVPRIEDFAVFQAANYFPLDYHGGINGPVWHEKLVEHWLAFDRLGLSGYQPADVYVDVAAGGSPWAKTLRERLGISSFAIDLNVNPAYTHLSFYRAEDATATTFADASVDGMSLQCAYEMFVGDDDINFIKELARILKPGGKAVISPLYMHTHYCAYSSPRYYGKGYSDPVAKEYVFPDVLEVPSSRKYDARELKRRVLDTVVRLGMHYKLLVLRNKADLGKDIYCHFILEISR